MGNPVAESFWAFFLQTRNCPGQIRSIRTKSRYPCGRAGLSDTEAVENQALYTAAKNSPEPHDNWKIRFNLWDVSKR